jgi:excisionase family DNA binding protein
MSRVVKWRDVMTLAEAARYLRVPKKRVEELAAQGSIPARRIGETWRFLKSGLDEWLKGQPDGKALLLQQFGAFADDETLPALRAAIYKARGRPETE